MPKYKELDTSEKFTNSKESRETSLSSNFAPLSSTLELQTAPVEMLEGVRIKLHFLSQNMHRWIM